MSAIRRIRRWFSLLVHRPADLFDIASGFATALFVLLGAWNHNDPQVSPSMSFIGDKAPWWLWFSVIGLERNPSDLIRMFLPDAAAI
jgi:hypothetical protein